MANQLARDIDINFDYNPFRSLAKRCLIAAAPRTGSHLLCEGLLKHGLVVQEFFDLKRIRQACARRGIYSLQEYCEEILLKFVVDGSFGVKGGVKILAPLMLAGEFPDHRSEWGFVYLKRLNFVRQGISEFKAKLTGSYKSAKQPSRELTDDDFNGSGIAKLIDFNVAIYATWEDTFKFFDINPLRLTYEELSVDPPMVSVRVADYLGWHGSAIEDERFLNPPLKVQSTDLDARWEARFRDENREFCATHEAVTW